MSTSKSLYECPMCKTAVQFSHAALNITICPFCKSVLDRNESDVLLVRPFGKIQASSDIVQPCTTGIFNNKRFMVTGRFRAWFADSIYNYWTIVFEDENVAYLAEGYGLYEIFIQKTASELLTPTIIKSLTAGNTKQLNNKELMLLSRSTSSRIEIEGEIKLPDNNAQFTFLELGTETKKVVIITYLKSYWLAYESIDVSATSLQLQNLATDNNKAKEIKCNTCSSKIAVKAYPYTQSCSCGQCGTQYKLNANGEYEKSGIDRVNHNKGDIAIGATGVIKGIQYEVIGYALKQELNTYAARWSEYTLYNKLEGFAFLSEYNGHWIYVRERNRHPLLKNPQTNKLNFDGEEFLIYNSYTYKVLDTLGEFPYHVYDTSGTQVKEFISPPEMWIEEKSSDSIDWFLGVHIERRILEKEFNAVLPYKVGIGAIEPKGYVNPATLIKITLIALLVFIAAHRIVELGKENKVVLENYYTFNDSLSFVNQVTDNIIFDKWKSDVAFEMVAPVDNSWLSISATLVNTKDGTEYSFEQGIEYYHGYDSDGSWSEGSTSETAYISSVPAGTYILQLHGERENTLSAKGFSIKVTYDTDINSNLFILIGFLIVLPVIWIIIIRNNEVRRWQNSDYSPYNYAD